MSAGIVTRVISSVVCTLVAVGAILPVAAAQTVETDGNTATAIRDLEFNGTTYDVEFVREASPALYGDPPVFDFADATEARDALDAVNVVLNAEGNIFGVGTSDAVASKFFRIGFGLIEVGSPGHPEARGTEVWEAATDVAQDPDLWVRFPEADQFPFLEDGTYADFTVVDSSLSNQPPVPETGGPYEGVVSTPVTFDASGSSDPDGTIMTYTWDFGDGSIVGGESVAHTYANSGIYNVTLTVTDDMGLSVSRPTVADIGMFSLRPTADTCGSYSGVADESLAFDGTCSEDSDGVIETYEWDFGDGTAPVMGLSQPTHIYNAAGTYAVVLTVTDDTGETDSTVTEAVVGEGLPTPTAEAGPPATGVVDVPVDFDGSGSTDMGDGIMSYDWDFGDGGSGTGATPSHTYVAPGLYNVTLVVTNFSGVTDTDLTTACVDAANQPPTADAGSPYTGVVGMPVSFDGSGSSDDSGILLYAWDFGDGTTGVGAMPSHTYMAAGNYCASLLVIDDDGAKATDFATASIDSDNMSPEANAGVDVAGVIDAPVTFDGTRSSDSDGYLVSMQWDFGDGGTGSGEQPQHTYAEAGTYEVILTVEDDRGAMDMSATQAVIAEGNALPIPDAGGPYNSVVGTPVTFDGSASSDPDGMITTFFWDFGDGATVGGETVAHTYASGDIYFATLTVTDDLGGTRSTTTTVDIGTLSLRPTADAGGPYSGEIAIAVSFDGTGSADADGVVETYEWDFGDGSAPIMGLAQPTHIYNAAGAYIVVLTVTDDTGETDSEIAEALIGEGGLPPQADDGGPYYELLNVPVTFDGSASSDPSGTITSYEWDFGDGTTGTGPNPVHTYAEGGTHLVTLTVTDDSGVPDTDATLAFIFGDIDEDGIPNDEDTDNDNDGIKDKVDVDRDGDGWDVLVETEEGTSDDNPYSFPEAGLEPLRGPGVKSLKVVRNFAKPDMGTINLKGSLQVAEDFDPAGLEVSFDFQAGDLLRTYTLDEKGKFKDKEIGETVSFKKAKRLKQSQTFISNYSISLKKQDLSEVFEQLDDIDAKKEPRAFEVTVWLDGERFDNFKQLQYTANLGKKGTAKQLKPPKN